MVARAGPAHSVPPGTWGVLARVGRAIADLLFPPRCVSCQTFGHWLCQDCAVQIRSIIPPICRRCGQPIREVLPVDAAPFLARNAGCPRCFSASSPLAGLRVCAFHAGPLRRAIHCLKYEDLRALAPPLGAFMTDWWQRLGADAPSVDVIVPVALHARRERERGYNQAALLAREVGRGLSIAVREQALVRTRATLPQVGLDASQRHENVAGAFRSSSGELSGSRVLLIDDVLTTGATLESAATALLDAGVLSVWGFALARAE